MPDSRSMMQGRLPGAALAARVRDAAGVVAPGVGVRRYGLLVLSAVIAVVVQLKYGRFLTVGNILTTLDNVSSFAIAGLGAAALLIAGRIDLSVGGQLALLSIVSTLVGKHVGSGAAGTAACAAVALGGGALLGLANALLVRALKISPLIVTIATGGVYLGAASAVTGGLDITGVPNGIMALGSDQWLGVPIPVLLALALFAVGGFYLLATVTGLRIYAIGGNGPGAELTGVPVERIVAGLFVLQGLLVGLVALISIGETGTASATFGGTAFELNTLTAVLLGGVMFTGGGGRPVPLALGVVTIGVLNAALVFIGLQSWWSDIIVGAVLLMALGSDQIAAHRREQRVLRLAMASDAGEPEQRDDGIPVRSVEIGRARPVASVVAPAAADDRSLLQARGIELRYGAVRALRGVDIEARPGEVTCLVGDNGAGKSSLVKVLSGVVRPTSGELRLGGELLHFENPLDARRHGIETVYQDLAICANLNVAHNVVLGAEPRRGGMLRVRDDRLAVAEARRRLELIGTSVVDYRQPLQQLSGGQRQAIAIARVLHDDLRVALFDEPTAALGVTQTGRVLELIREVARQGIAVILVTHDIEAVLGAADRIVALRLGQVSFAGRADGLDEADLAQFMAGVPAERVQERKRTTTPVA